MTTPISNNLPAALSNNKTGRAEERGEKGAGQSGSPAEEAAAPQSSDTVTLSRAAEVLSKPAEERGEGSIHSAEEAASAAADLKAMFAAEPAKALAANGAVSSDIMALLKNS